jgi:hypothetical protein
MSENSLLLVVDAWDLCLDAAGNIAMATPPYSRAQSVANALRLFAGELWYDTTKGVPYFEQILGQAPPVTFFEAEMVRAALTVPGVASAQCTIQGISGRVLTGQVTFTSDDGTTDSVTLANL